MNIGRPDFQRISALGVAARPPVSAPPATGVPQRLERRGPAQRVIVVGAGLAGLCAAFQLKLAGHDVLVLEAQRRPGGRVHTLRDFAEDLHGEAGAARIPHHHPCTMHYVRLFGLELEPFMPAGAPVYHLRGRRFVARPGETPAWPLAPPLRPVDGLPLGPRYSRIRGGNDRLPHAFALRLAGNIRYGCPVVCIESSGGGLKVVVEEPGGRQSLAADRVVVATPFTLLRRIEIVPPFSEEKTRAIAELTYASSCKVFLQTRTRFWAKDGLSGFGYTDRAGYLQVWEHGQGQRGPRGLLVAYSKMAGARQFGGLDEERRIAAATEAVSHLHPGLPGEVEGGVSKSWDEDPWARGAWAMWRPGDTTQLRPHVARPEGRVHFAGEHTSPWPPGWMQSALESGERVAKEINDAH